MTKYISAFCICALLSVFSCTDPNLIGLEVEHPSDGISVVLTSANNNLKLSTISEDSLRSDEASTLLLGKITNDMIFGNSSASFATQLQLPFNNVDVGNSDSLIVDSVVLGLSYSGSYGINDVLSIMVYELDEPIYKDSVYYSNEEFCKANTCNLLYSQITTINTKDSVMVGGEMKAPHLRLKLDNMLGDKILNESGGPNLENNVQFLDFFQGLVLSINDGGSIAYFSPTAANTQLSIYYHSTKVDSLSLNFPLSGDVARVNLFEKDTFHLFNQADTSSNTYVQSMAGYKTVVEIQQLDTLKTFFKNKAINRVTISFELNGLDTLDFSPHERMFLVRVDDEGKDFFLRDYIVEGEEYFGGTLKTGKYTFNITRYFYQLLADSDYTNKLYLVASGGAVNAERTILPKEKISFNIIYTDL